jgi:AAA ATPase domain
MPGPGELPAQQHAPIIGRDAGLARLRGLVDPVPRSSQVLLVTGEAGMGKTVLLADAVDRARLAGMRVLSITGRESESRLAFAGLHQLLRPVLPVAADLPDRQAQALLGALGLAADPGAPDPLLTGAAVLTLLSDLSERSPVLVVADDAHWLDRSSLDALAFAASRLDAERVVLLVGARGQAPPAGFDRGFPELHLEPLSAADAGLLLDAQPRPPRGRARAHVLAQAGGNPMALIELARVIADDPAASRRWAAEPLPPSDRLAAVLTSRFAALPEPARAALLLAAVADGPDLSAAVRHGAGPEVRALAPAEQLGLVKIDRTGLQFSHPLVRSAIYHSAPLASVPRRTASSRACCTTSQTGGPGIWPLRPCILTSRWRRCWKPPRPRRNAAGVRPRRRWSWNARPSSAPTPETRPARRPGYGCARRAFGTGAAGVRPDGR